jgi:hypothetical protein
MKDPSRMTQLRRALCLSLLAIAICPYAGAQSRRDPTPAEKLVLMKPFDALNAAILPFLKAHDLELDPSSADFNETQSVPIKGVIGGAFEWKCTVKQNSDRFNVHLKPMMERIEQLMQSGLYEEVKSLRQEMNRWNHLDIGLELNSEALDSGAEPGRNMELSIAGVAKGFVVADDKSAPVKSNRYILAFGNWQAAKHDAATSADRFHFVHPPQTPFVENMVITISGAEDLIKALLDKTDWIKIANSLTR